MNSPSWREGLKTAAASAVPGTATQLGALLVLLLLASVLRLWDLPHIPYTHDEISALVRIYPSLGETIRTGVIELDTHPPGVQVFEWAWTKLFGMGEAAVKLPFILMSIAALFLLYRFAFAWCGGQVALIMTALLATLQYTVMYGQIARPYAAGLFTTALLADQLTRYLGSGSRRALFGIAIASVLCAYTHHFALMLAAFMVLTSFFLVLPEKRKEYLTACAVAAVTYLPNIPIFLKQLGAKGLDEWLAAPTSLWIPDYLWWLAHCSVIFAAAWGLLIAASAALRIRHRGVIAPLWAIALFWGILPLAVGYAYSVWRSPVLQYSVVIFSFPYLLLGVLAGLRHMREGWVVPIAMGISAIATITLITERKYYEIFYRSRYEAITRGIIEAGAQTGRLALLDGPDHVVEFYLHHWKVDPATAPFFSLHDRSAAWLDSLLNTSTASSAFYGATAAAVPEHAARIRSAFPFLLERHDMEEGQTFLFSGMPKSGTVEDLSHISMVTPEAVKGEGWKVDEDLPTSRDTSGTFKLAPKSWDLNGREFGAVFERSVFDLISGDNDILEARMEVVDASPGSELKLVMELMEGDRSIFYRTSGDGPEPGSSTLITAVPLADIHAHGQGTRLKTYFWNPNGGPARIASIEVRVREGNPWLYGLFQPLREPLIFP